MSEQHIPLIYNYCDRWCERCAFTSRCKNYERNTNVPPEQNDIHNQAFWEGMSSHLEEAIVLLKQVAEQEGINLEKLMAETDNAAYEERRKNMHERVHGHIIMQLANQYAVQALRFTRKEEPLREPAEMLQQQVNLNLVSETEARKTVALLTDCYEVIGWYAHLVGPKLSRALHGQFEGYETDDYPKDSDGSAKIALIAIQRSMAAWMGLYRHLPAAEDTALNCLALLDKLTKEVNQSFPRAMQFKRPGFDD